MTGDVEPSPDEDLNATITDGAGRELISFKLGKNERFLMSFIDGDLICRKLARDEHLWSKETMLEVIREMVAKN
ncbi:hypothetical protein ORL26_18125 [Raoultella ornithinolytica]|uniref:hypothetical protein n=1 Tax=Raoultella ornithinolytica TaxID=54291 RepID=UPI0022481406|nr:hypothetical protein [Raoultella ornithinolytica]MCW9581298.1 hypothetical protein [Raoultella ornithinolytica]